MVHQHFMLADNLTVAGERAARRREPRTASAREARARIGELAASCGLHIEPGVLRGAPRRRRPAARGDPQGALPRRAHHDPGRADRGARAAGGRRAVRHPARHEGARAYTFLFISHKLDEVRAIADAITVIRRGTTRRHGGPARPSPAAQLAEMMVGSELPVPGDARVDGHRREVLRARGPHAGRGGRRACRCWTDVVLTVHAGEVLGIAGVEGNGQTELVETIMGMRHGERRPGRAGGQRTCTARARWPAARPASATSPKTAPPRAAARVAAAVGEPHPRLPDPAAGGAAGGWAARPARGAPRHRAHRRRVRRAHPGHRRAPPPRSPAATSRSSSSAASSRATPCCSSPRTPPAAWTSAPRPAIWDELRQARAAGPRGAADLRRPGRADRAVRLIAVILRGRLVADGGPGDRHARGARRGDDRRRRSRRRGGGRVNRVRTVRCCAPALAVLFAALLCAVALLVSGDNPLTALASDDRRRSARAPRAVDIVNSAAVVLPRRARRGHRLPDEPVQHRRRGPVPAGRPASPRSSAGRVALPPVLHSLVILLVGALVGAAWAGIAGAAQGLPRGQRGHLDDHAELHRDRA